MTLYLHRVLSPCITNTKILNNGLIGSKDVLTIAGDPHIYNTKYKAPDGKNHTGVMISDTEISLWDPGYPTITATGLAAPVVRINGYTTTNVFGYDIHPTSLFNIFTLNWTPVNISGTGVKHLASDVSLRLFDKMNNVKKVASAETKIVPIVVVAGSVAVIATIAATTSNKTIRHLKINN